MTSRVAHLVPGGRVRFLAKELLGMNIPGHERAPFVARFAPSQDECHHGLLNGEVFVLGVNAGLAIWDAHLEDDSSCKFGHINGHYFDPLDEPYLHVGGLATISVPSLYTGYAIGSSTMQADGLDTWSKCEGLTVELVEKSYWNSDNKKLAWKLKRLGKDNEDFTLLDSWLTPIGSEVAVVKRAPLCPCFLGACHCGAARAEMVREMALVGKGWCKWTKTWVKR